MMIRVPFALMLVWAPFVLHAATRPVIAPGPTRTEYSGVMVEDPYRQLEQLNSPQVQAWARGQADYARSTLDRLPGLLALRTRLEAINASIPERIRWIQRTDGGRVFYLKQRAEDPVPKLYVRDALGKPERLVLDPHEKGGASLALLSPAASPDGRYIAAIVAAGDAEVGELRVWEVATGAAVTESVRRVWGESPVVWLPDSSGFFYRRTMFGENEAPYGRMRVSLRLLKQGNVDRPMLGWNVANAPAAREADWPSITVIKGSPYVMSKQSEGANSTLRISVARVDELTQSNMQWRRVVDEAAGVREAVLWGHWLYLRTFQGASRFQIQRIDLSQPDPKVADWIPEQKGVIEQIGAAADGLYFVVREGAVSELYRASHEAGAPKIVHVTAPYRGALELTDVQAGIPGALVAIDAWTQSRQLLTTRVDSPALENTQLLSPATTQNNNIEAVETRCAARDGAQVPVSILTSRGLKRDGRAPTLLYGYGGYGITETAGYNPNWIAWVERGAVLAIVNPRGSGAYGEDWYRAGVGPTKANTWRDMIDCGRMLVADHYTSPAKLAIFGGSMGGIAAGRALTEQPDLFAAGAVFVGVLDTVRGIEASINGPSHEREMGSPKTRAGIEQLLNMSSYHHVSEGVRYPAVLLAHGINDKRVDPWQSMKMAARLQAASISGKPVLLRLDMQSGHGLSAETAQRIQLYADTYAFLLWQLGDRAFQPSVN